MSIEEQFWGEKTWADWVLTAPEKIKALIDKYEFSRETSAWKQIKLACWNFCIHEIDGKICLLGFLEGGAAVTYRVHSIHMEKPKNFASPIYILVGGGWWIKLDIRDSFTSYQSSLRAMKEKWDYEGCCSIHNGELQDALIDELDIFTD